ncbi:GNAT family N-acetyltransferase [Cohnella zeiphila]|uniref:GNAT family N-acetyltransferase n=1 Tax=Cohnella zeiphila TaxID=2761120 RepID=A0A7X0VU23_9BACL|nr:GNAT family N-acetyltransferase [Cohnella zeiphila]MBB6729925.1 GNAT family N-acetyltransferase [Cohnella zeiphila]
MIFERLEERHLDEALSIWNAELGGSYPLRPRLLRQNVAADSRLLREGSWVARDPGTGAFVGFVIAKTAGKGDERRFGLREDAGWIHALLTASAWRGKGIGGALLGRAEEALRAAGVRRIVLGNDLHRRMFPGIPGELAETKRWFEKRGYVSRENVYDLIKAYDTDEETALPSLGEAAARVATPRDRDALTAFMARCFPGTWDLQHRDYWERGGTGREYVVLEKQGKLIGFCRMNDGESPLLAQNVYWAPLFEDELGGIGPLGIDEAYRGHRYGISIVQAAIHFLRERGIRRIVIDTTPFVDFYGKLGYEVWKRYAKYDKSLD